MTHRHGANNQQRYNRHAAPAAGLADQHRHRHLTDALHRTTRHNLEQITADAWQWSPGVPATTTQPKVSGSNEPRLPINTDPDWATELDTAITNAANTLAAYTAQPTTSAARTAVIAVDALDHLCWTLTRPTTQRPTRQTSTGVCACCQRTVPGTPTNRLRSGLCNACTAATQRLAQQHPGWDRTDRIRHHTTRKETA